MVPASDGGLIFPKLGDGPALGALQAFQ